MTGICGRGVVCTNLFYNQGYQDVIRSIRTSYHFPMWMRSD